MIERCQLPPLPGPLLPSLQNNGHTGNPSGNFRTKADDSRPWPENMGAMGVQELDFARPMIIQAGIFCGKKSTAHIYILPAYAETIWTKEQ